MAQVLLLIAGSASEPTSHAKKVSYWKESFSGYLRELHPTGLLDGVNSISLYTENQDGIIY